MVKYGVPFSIKGLEVFLAVCRGNGIASAAREFGLSQPSVSQRIAELEKSLGVELFDRSRRPLSLTPAGIVLQRRAEELVSDASGITSLLLKVGKVKIPSLRVGMVDSLGKALSASLYRFLADKCEQGSIFAGPTSTHTDALLVRKLDVFIGPSQLNELERLERWPVVEEPFILVLPRSVSTPSDIPELNEIAQRLTLLRYSARSTIGAEIDIHCRRLQLSIPKKVEFDTAEQVALALSCGDAWAITTPFCVFQGQLDPARFHFARFPDVGFRRHLALIARARELGAIPEQLAAHARQAITEQMAPFVAENMNWLEVSDSDAGVKIRARPMPTA